MLVEQTPPVKRGPCVRHCATARLGAKNDAPAEAKKKKRNESGGLLCRLNRVPGSQRGFAVGRAKMIKRRTPLPTVKREPCPHGRTTVGARAAKNRRVSGGAKQQNKSHQKKRLNT